MPYAIVDIETTGSYANGNGITEIAIILYNGSITEGKYHTLINPGMPVPRYITSLTGITNEMLYDQPGFEAVAGHIYNLLKDRIFVAHNVNFDYSFIKQALDRYGYHLNTQKLCTVRLSRKVFPGYARYNLGAICRELDIPLFNAHRATGDAEATTELFARLIAADKAGHIREMLKGRNKEQYLPMNLPVEQLEQLPALPGVYYFYNRVGKVVYVGKAANLRKRVKSHFSNNDGSKRKQDLIKDVCGISHKVCGTELMALIFENIEIRRLWPAYNRSQKKFSYTYGLYSFTGQNGYIRLAVEKKQNRLQPLHTFNSLPEGYQLLKKLIGEFGLHPGMCFIDRTEGQPKEDVDQYNTRVLTALESLQRGLPTFALVDKVAHSEEMPCLLMDQGKFYGMGYLPANFAVSDLNTLKEALTQYPDSDYIRGLVYKFVSRYPDRKIAF